MLSVRVSVSTSILLPSKVIHCRKHLVQSFIHPSHRETLLGQLSGYVRSVRDDFTSRSSSGPAHHQRRPVDPAQAAAAEKQAPPTGKNMPEVVNNIVWTQQLEAKVRDIVQV